MCCLDRLSGLVGVGAPWPKDQVGLGVLDIEMGAEGSKSGRVASTFLKSPCLEVMMYGLGLVLIVRGR